MSTISSSEIKSYNQLVWIVASKHATNSASMVDAATTDCFALFHDTAHSTKRNAKPRIDFLVSTHPAKSKFEYPITSR